MRYPHVFMVAVALILPQTGLGAVGRTPGSFSVSPTGAATYTIPIWATPGPNGLQPNIALTYNSQQGGGYVGVGWSIAGLSSIYRCGRTFAQDGAPAPVALSFPNDALCIDGKRLRLTSSDTLSTYGQVGTTYQTEIADFSNITANGTAGQAPAYFTVQGKDGRTYEYGNSANNSYAQVVATGTSTPLAWMLDKVTDRAGNTMTIAYTAPSATLTGMTAPATISWTPSAHGSNTYNYTMTFGYNSSTNQASVSSYVAGTQVLNEDLLLTIAISSGTSVVKQYNLSYGNPSPTPSPTTNAYRLTQVQECADATQTNCLLPTTIGYQNGTVGVSSSATTVLSAPVSGDFNAHYDFNGDGYPDIAYQVGSTWYVAFGSASGYGTGITTGVSGSRGVNVLFGDLKGSGRAGILATNGGSVWNYYTWNGSSFSGTPSNLSFDSTAQSVVLADIDGDGLPDFVSLYYSSSSQTVQLYSRLNTGGGTTATFSTTNVLAYSNTSALAPLLIVPDSQYGSMKSFDFNGDGRQDLAITLSVCGNFQFGVCTLYDFPTAALLAQSGGTFVGSPISDPGFNNTSPTVYFGNLNDDACTDTIVNGTAYISGCNGNSATTLSVGTVVATMDWNGDGRTDLIVTDGSSLYAVASTDTGLGSATQISAVSYHAYCHYVVLDTNADGLDDLGCMSITSGTAGFVYYVHNGQGQRADLATSISDGYGNSASPSYVSISQSAYTTCNGTNCPLATYPEKELAGPMYVVSQVAVSDGIGGTYTQNYAYTSARQSLNGYGFEGFLSVTTSDNRSLSLARTTSYQTAFPYTGMASQDDVFRHDGPTLVSHAVYTNSKTDLDQVTNNQRRLVFVASSSVQDHDLTAGAPVIRTTATTTNTMDLYGNATDVQTTVTDSDAGSPFNGNSWTTRTVTQITEDPGSNWCLTQPTQIAVTRSGTGITALTRTTGFGTPDYMNCRPTHQITEPSGSYTLTQTFGYDVFGNISSVAVSGTNVTQCSPCTATTDWGTTGQFPVTVKDPVGYALGATGYKTVNGYDFNLGVQTSQVVQSADGSVNNAPPTTWVLDAFGRRTRENRPDGTYTLFAYTDCAGSCVVGAHALVLGRTDYKSDATIQTDGTTYFDPLDRPLVSSQRTLALGSYDRNEVRYDNFGRVLTQAIPCSWAGLGAACLNVITNQYDALGRVVQVQRPKSASDTSPQYTNIAYTGDTVVTTDPQLMQTTKVLTAIGTVGVSKDHNGYSQSFVYDAFESVVQVNDSLTNRLFTASYQYGVRAFQTDAADSDLDVSMNAGHRHFTYDALGEVTGSSDANGNSSSQTYDALSRPVGRTETLASAVVDLTTTWTWGTNAANHEIGQLASVSTGGGYSETFTYDATGRLSKRRINLGTTCDTTTNCDYDYTYGTTGLLDTLTYPASTAYRLKLQYTYQNGFLQSISDANTSAAFWTANAADVRGHVTQETLGNNVVTSRSFDAVTGWMSLIQSGLSTAPADLQNESYSYDMVGNLIQRQNGRVSLTENFIYDNLYRLDHSTLQVSSGPATTNLQMAYDPMGNISSRSDVSNNATWTYDPNRKHAVTQVGTGGGSLSYSYDNNGNMTSRNGASVSWTSYNHPSQINGAGESVSFSYNQDHLRWSSIYSGPNGNETTYFIGGLLEKVVTSGVNDFRHYIFAGNTQVAIYSRTSTGTNTLRYVREDRQGSVAGIVNSGDGSSYVKESFTAYGARRNCCTWTGLPTSGMLNRINAVSRHGYTWQTALGNMGLNDMNGRIEDAVLGRFLSADLYVSDAMSTQSYNRYSYVNNNPLTYTDPSGFCLVSFGGGEPYDDGQDCPGVDVSAARSHTDGSQGYHCGDWDCVSQITQLLGRNLLDFPIIAVPGSGGDGLEEVKVTAKKIPWKQCGPHSLLIHGIGLSGGANAEAGAGLAGAAAQVSAGGGAFHNSNGGWSRGSYTTYGAAANALNAVAGTPAQSSTPVVAGASFGGGASVFVTNAQSVQQLTGPFTSYSLNVGVGPAQFSAQLSVGGGIWQFGVSPPYAGETLGLSVSKITTNTVSSSTGGCQ